MWLINGRQKASSQTTKSCLEEVTPCPPPRPRPGGLTPCASPLPRRLAAVASGRARRACVTAVCSWLGRRVGPWMVAAVVTLTAIVVATMHAYVFPDHLRRHGAWAWAAQLPVAHYLLLNVVFHYAMANTTPAEAKDRI